MSGPDWNPNDPSKIGVELLDVGYAHDLVDAAGAAAWLQWEAQSSLSCGQIEVHAGAGASAPVLPAKYNDLNRPMILDVVEAGDELPDDVVINDFSPTAITGGPSSGMTNEDGSAINVNRLTGLNDGLYIRGGTQGGYFEVTFGGASSYALTRHVLAVEFYMAINLTTGIRRIDTVSGGQPWSYNVPMYTSGNQLVSVRHGEAIADGTNTEWTWWTPTKIRQFANASQRRIRISCQAGPGYWRIDRLFMRVYSQTERRVGVGIGMPVSPETWVPFPMLAPDESGTMPQTSGQEYTALLRRITDYSLDSVGTASLPWRYMRGYDPGDRWRRLSGSYPALTPGASARIAVLPPVAAEGIPSARLWNTSVTTVRIESQPYELSRGSGVWDTEVSSQLLTVGGATSYGQVYAVVGWRPQTGRPEGPLIAEVFTSPGGVSVLGPTQLTAEEVELLPTSAPVNAIDSGGVVYKTAVFRFPASATLAAGTYEVRLSSPASGETRPWSVSALIGEPHTTDRSFGGTTEHAEGDIFIESTHQDLTAWSADLLAQLVTVPPPVTGVAATPDVVDLAGTAMVCGPNCALSDTFPEDMPVVTLTWSPAPTGTPEVVGYQVDRQDPETEEWQRVAAVTGRGSTEWQDTEPPIGINVSYQVRSLRADGVTGDWSAPATTIIDATDLVGLYFSSNAATGMGCAYPEVWGGDQAERQWEFTEFGDVTLRRIYGRNRPVAFRPLERQGDSFRREVMLASGCVVDVPTMSLFKPLRDLAWAPVPYVAVRDTEGNVWRASVLVPEGANARSDPNGNEVWSASVGVTEVADVPAVADTSVPQVTGPATVPT